MFNIFFPITCRLWDNQENQSTTGQVTDDNKTHAPGMLDNYGYTHNLKTCNIYFFSTAEMVTRTHHNVTLYAR